MQPAVLLHRHVDTVKGARHLATHSFRAALRTRRAERRDRRLSARVLRPTMGDRIDYWRACGWHR